MKGRLKISSDGLFIFIKESEMLVYMDDEGFDEGRIKAPILRTSFLDVHNGIGCRMAIGSLLHFQK